MSRISKIHKIQKESAEFMNNQNKAIYESATKLSRDIVQNRERLRKVLYDMTRTEIAQHFREAKNELINNGSLNESDKSYRITKLEKEIDEYYDFLRKNSKIYEALQMQRQSLNEAKIKLEKEASEKGVNLEEDEKTKDLDFDFNLTDKKKTKKEEEEDSEDEKVKDVKEDKTGDEEVEDTEDTEEDEEDEEKDKEEPETDDDEIELSSIVLEVSDVDAVIEELKGYDIPEDAIKIIEEDEDEDEKGEESSGKIKVDADYVKELSDYCASKGFDLEEELGGKITSDEDDDEEDEEKSDSDDTDDLSDDEIFGDIFGDEDDEEDDNEKETSAEEGK